MTREALRASCASIRSISSTRARFRRPGRSLPGRPTMGRTPPTALPRCSSPPGRMSPTSPNCTRAIVYAQLLDNGDYYLVDHPARPDRRHRRRRHRAGHPERMPRHARVSRRRQGGQASRNLRGGGARRRHLALLRGPCGRLGVEPRAATAATARVDGPRPGRRVPVSESRWARAQGARGPEPIQIETGGKSSMAPRPASPGGRLVPAHAFPSVDLGIHGNMLLVIGIGSQNLAYGVVRIANIAFCLVVRLLPRASPINGNCANISFYRLHQ